MFEPVSVIWHITNRCNSNCKYCFTNSSYSEEISENTSWEKIVEKINDTPSIKRVSIIGGEPLLISNLPQILESLREDIIINIDSNLTNIKQSWNPIFKKAYFCTTIDSIEEEIHNKTRDHSSKKTIEGIKFLLQNGIKVMTVVVVSKYNIKTLEKTVDYLFKIGVDKVGISRPRMSGRALSFNFDYFYPNLKQFKNEALKIIKNLIEKHGKENIVVYNLWHDKKFFDLGYEYEPSCKCALFRISLDWEGFVYPCELMPFYWEKFYDTYGFDRKNLSENSISDIFNNSELFKFFRKNMLFYPAGCERCYYKNKCNHGCRFYSWLILGNLLAKDVICRADSLYDVLGYRHYSPLFEEGKERLKGELSAYLKKSSNKLGNNIYDLGCGGGLWTFYLEDLGKQVTGVDNNRTMILMAKEFKEMYNKKAQFINENFLTTNLEKKDSAIMLDNTVGALNKEELRELCDKLQDKVNFFAVEIYKNPLKKETFEYKFGGFDINEKIVPIGKEKFKRIFKNKQTGAEFQIISYSWNKDILLNLLKKYGKINEVELKNSYIIEVYFLQQK